MGPVGTRPLSSSARIRASVPTPWRFTSQAPPERDHEHQGQGVEHPDPLDDLQEHRDLDQRPEHQQEDDDEHTSRL